MAGSSRTSVFMAVIAALAVTAPILASSALAQPVPLPTPRPQSANRPHDVTGTVANPAARPQVPAAAMRARAQAQQAEPPSPILVNPFAALLGKRGSTVALNPDQREIIDRVSNYLSNLRMLVGNFVQVGPDGRRTQGQLYMQKPGKVRFEYDPPSPIDIIADGDSLVVRDRRLATQDLYPLSQTPLRFLLADNVNLLQDTNLVAVYADDVFITIVVEEKNTLAGTSRLMIMFAADDMQLKQWTVTDPQGYDTTVAVYNLDTSKRPDPALFRIDYTVYRN